MNRVASDQRTGLLKYSHTVGLATMEGRGFFFPSDTAVGRDGRIYTVNRSVEIDSRGVRVTVYDLDSNFFGTFGSFGDGDGQFISPTAVAVDGTDRVYVSDEYTHRIVVFDSEGGSITSWGTRGDGPGELNSPSGMAFDGDDNLYVADHRNHRVQKFDKKGGFISSFGSEGAADGCLNLPWGLTVDAKGDVYVADWRNDRIQRFSADGEFLGKFGSPGRGDGQLRRPSSVAVDAQGFVYVGRLGQREGPGARPRRRIRDRAQRLGDGVEMGHGVLGCQRRGGRGAVQVGPGA